MSYQEGTTPDQTVSDDIRRKNATRDIFDAIVATGLKNACQAFRKARLEPLLKGPEQITVFAPSDEAFAPLAPNTIQDEERMAGLMRCHIVKGAIRTIDLRGQDRLPAAGGGDLRIEHDGPNIRVDGARIIAPDIICTNGVIHIVDGLFQPATSGGAA